ncbi:hypothetical protein SAMN05443667_113106 [Flavobacterium gillisiae]|uniref:Uncharacterized protein n=1 Tax=Flavobacterium gillisiae TaxID=150146 RepID=A0A1H4FGT6_9FLAO|nr:hypothetical protein [Flavobacterium gillisiae]SEA96569.1 hypothetical protein SAMN05443667_113106 [Flavobacterium gillisiae]
MLINRIDKIELEIFKSLFDYEKLNMTNFESFDDRFKYPIIENNMNRIKAYLRTLKKDKYFAEYVYALNMLKNKIEVLNDDLKKNNLLESYDQYLFDFEPIKNKELINDYLINFIERFVRIAVFKHFDEILEYQKKINIEYFINRHPKLRDRYKILKKNIEAINNEMAFGTSKNIVFGGFDMHTYCNDLFLIPLIDKKEIFEIELDKIILKIEQKGIIVNKLVESLLDLSDSTATEKIIYLQKLGVIDFLRKKNNISINGLASALSAITGEKATTIQSAINPIISKDAGQKNNPLNTDKTVKKVEKQLINIGFNLDETI